MIQSWPCLVKGEEDEGIRSPSLPPCPPLPPLPLAHPLKTYQGRIAIARHHFACISVRGSGSHGQEEGDGEDQEGMGCRAGGEGVVEARAAHGLGFGCESTPVACGWCSVSSKGRV